MNVMIHQHGKTGITRVVDQFEATDIGAPFKVVLKDSVKVTSDPDTGEIISYTIPDPDGLFRAIVITRILHHRKLFGADIKFLRKAVGVKQKDLAKAIELSPEHLSKCEAGSLPIGPSSEKLLRIFLFKTVIKHHKLEECEAKRKLEDALDQLFDVFTPVAAYDAGSELELCFSRRAPSRRAANDGADEGCWDKFEQMAA